VDARDVIAIAAKGRALYLVAECISCAGEDDDAISMIGSNIAEQIDELCVSRRTVTEFAAPAMQLYLQNTIATFEARIFIFVSIALQYDHVFPRHTLTFLWTLRFDLNLHNRVMTPESCHWPRLM